MALSLDTQDLNEKELSDLRESLKNPDFQEFLVKQTQGDEISLAKGPNVKFVVPSPGFCLRVLDKHAVKVFINVVECLDVGPVSVKRGLVDDEEQEGLNVPISCCGPRPDVDSHGNKCLVFDVAANITTVDRAKKDDEFENFLCSFVVQYIESKHSLGLQPRMPSGTVCVVLTRAELKVLRKRKCKGNPMMQSMRADGGRVKIEETPRIQELTATPVKAPAAVQPVQPSAPVEAEKPRKAGYVLDPVGQQPDGLPEFLSLCFTLPKLVSMKGVDLDITPDVVSLQAAGICNFEVKLPHTVDVDDCEPAKFEKRTETLRLKLRVLPQVEVDNRLLAEKVRREQDEAEAQRNAEEAARRRARVGEDLQRLTEQAKEIALKKPEAQLPPAGGAKHVQWVMKQIGLSADFVFELDTSLSI